MTTRRDFLKKATYTAPVIMTFGARPSYAGQGSRSPGKNGGRKRRRRDRNGQQRRNRRDGILAWLRGLFG